LSRSARK